MLILDNCEHLVGAVAQLAHALLVACPDLRILAISGGGAGGGETQLLRFAESFGADQTLPKPFTGSQLVAAVRALLASRGGKPGLP